MYRSLAQSSLDDARPLFRAKCPGVSPSLMMKG